MRNPLTRTAIGLCGAVVITVSSASCNRLSHEAREIVGDYIIPEVSQTEPVMELKEDATCRLRAIRPGVLTYTVDGVWNVERDSLVMTLDPTTVKVDGDSTLVGDIPVHSTRKVVEHTDFNLLLEKDGVTYSYKRI